MQPAKNIYIIRASCTGKTTLVNALKEHYYSLSENVAPKIVTETARPVLEELKFQKKDYLQSPENTLTLQQAILKAQYQAEHALDAGTASWYISDRSGLDPVVYTRIFVGETSADNLLASTEWLALEAKMRRATILLCEAGSSWLEDDGVRWMPQNETEWNHHDMMFRQVLDDLDFRYTIIPRNIIDIKLRVKFALEAHATAWEQLE